MKKIDLSEFVPFELLVDWITNQIIKADDIHLSHATRKLFDMSSVIYDQDWLGKQQENFDLYYMYRDLTRTKDKSLFKEYKVRFDVTIIPPNFLGKEYVKTAGHFHPEAKDGFSYPEVYEIMSGEGIYLLQREALTSEPINVIVITGKKGDQILIPPGYGHITINPSPSKTLVMNNLVSSEFNSIYGSIKEMKGACYFLLKDGKWIKNENYGQQIVMHKKSPNCLSKKPFYHSFLENPDEWKFLNEPWIKANW